MKLKKTTKLILVIIYIIGIVILSFSAFSLYQDSDRKISFKSTINLNDYSYIKISKMSEAFAVYKKQGTQLHFVEEKDKNDKYHIYVVSIKTKDYDKYKDLIDYTYERKDNADTIKVYGYPIVINDKVKELSLKNIDKFLPVEYEGMITSKNFNKYIKNVYLDTTSVKRHNFNYISTILLIMDFLLIMLLMFTCFYKED